MLGKFLCAIMRVSTELRNRHYEQLDLKTEDDSRPTATPDDAHEQPGNVKLHTSAQSVIYPGLEGAAWKN